MFFVLFCGTLLFYHDLVMYGIGQAKGQLNIVRKARPIAEVLVDPEFPDSLKTNLRLIDDIKRFAFDSLGINYSENYSKVFDQKGKESMFVVSACQPHMLEPKQWAFPLIGTFSYKGFFDVNKAVELAKQLKHEGLDTNVRTAGGWSTLGWFEDPILSKMLEDSEAEFAETIIHELTHGTLFVKDSLRFNENLATFIGIKGTELYLGNKYGFDSKELIVYQNTWKDRNALSKHILVGAIYLDSLYRSMNENMTVAEKDSIKEESINKIIHSIDTLNLIEEEKYKSFYKKKKPNNTFFMSYLRYRGDFKILEKELITKYDQDLKMMLEDYKNQYPSL